MIKLSENIKKNRSLKGMTQSQLASVFNVSEQAVSRWENGNTYPDISLLPGIADYFGISIDELMGMESYKDERETERIVALVKENERKGLICESIKILEEAAQKYPTNYVILNYLVSMLNFEHCEDETKERKNCERAIKISDRILDECKDKYICNFIVHEKINSLQKLGRINEAVELAKEQPGIWESSNFKLINLLEGDELKEHCKNSAMQFAQLLYWTIYQMSDLSFKDDSLSIRERINIARKGLDVLELVYEGNYGAESRLVAQMNRYIAAMEALEGRVNATLEHLEKAAEFAIKYDSLPEKVIFTSTLLNGKEFNSSTIFKNFTWTECTELNERLSQDRYNFVRDTDSFKAVEKKISEYINEKS